MKKLMIVTSVVLLAIGLNVLPAFAYSTIGGSAMVITASGTLSGSTITFDATCVDAGSADANPAKTITFGTVSNPTDLTNSNRVIKVTGGSNEVDARIIIYTDNTNNTTSPNVASTVNPNTGVDGAGLVGRDNAGYAVPLIWGAKAVADYDPNSNTAYTQFTKANLDTGLYCVYIVDKRHTKSFTTVGSSLDNMAMYTAAGTAVTNTTGDGLYPQFFGGDTTAHPEDLGTLYTTALPATRAVASEALYKNISTVAFGIGPGTASGDTNNYVCLVPKLDTATGTDSVKARLGLLPGKTGTTYYLYINIAANFVGVPAQTYGTGTLTVEMVKA